MNTETKVTEQPVTPTAPVLTEEQNKHAQVYDVTKGNAVTSIQNLYQSLRLLPLLAENPEDKARLEEMLEGKVGTSLDEVMFNIEEYVETYADIVRKEAGLPTYSEQKQEAEERQQAMFEIEAERERQIVEENSEVIEVTATEVTPDTQSEASTEANA